MQLRRFCNSVLIAALSMPLAICGQDQTQRSELRLHITPPSGAGRSVPAVLWLDAGPGTPALSFVPHGTYTLLQKNRTFVPHLQVIPVGSAVQFPNADPFFHNVFSLFEGKRFDLGLYEAGSTKSVTFSRQGVSYIFCNIHPEMSAVVLALSTPLYAIADAKDAFVLEGIPPGDYRLHLWIEGIAPSTLSGLSRTVHIASHSVDLGNISVPLARSTQAHTNKFDKPYSTDSSSPY